METVKEFKNTEHTAAKLLQIRFELYFIFSLVKYRENYEKTITWHKIIKENYDVAENDYFNRVEEIITLITNNYNQNKNVYILIEKFLKILFNPYNLKNFMNCSFNIILNFL